MLDIATSLKESAVIKVIGVGGGGGNAVKHMVVSDIGGVEFYCANTDIQALSSIAPEQVVQLGSEITKGLGAGANPEIGRQAALEDRVRITQMMQGADMVFITAGMGGGTGSGAAPVVADVARNLGILTVAVVTKPFPFEGVKRMKIAEAAIEELKKNVDSIIIVPNEKLMEVLGKDCSLVSAFNSANDVLSNAVKGISELITCEGMINVDFADVKSVMLTQGIALMGTGVAGGVNRAREATKMAVKSPLLEETDLKDATGILVNITAGLDLSLGEFSEVGKIVQDYTSKDTTVVIGTVIDSSMGADIKVTMVVTGLSAKKEVKSKKVTYIDKKRLNKVVNGCASIPSVALSAINPQQDLQENVNDSINAVISEDLAVRKAAQRCTSSHAAKRLDDIEIPALLRR